MKKLLRSNAASPMIGALIWIVVSAVTGATVLFIIVGGVLCFVVIYAVQEAFRRVLAVRRARLNVTGDHDRGRPPAEPSSGARPPAPPEHH